MANNSYGEKCVAAILYREHIKFYRECKARGMIGPNGYPQRFDFWLPDYNIAIEVDGIQHYQVLNGDYKRFNYQRICDIGKNKYCLLHGINLYRIPSKDIANITSFQELIDKKYLVDDLIKYTPHEYYTNMGNYILKQSYIPKDNYTPKQDDTTKENYTPQEIFTPQENYVPQQDYTPKQNSEDFNSWIFGLILFIVFVIIPLILISPYLYMILR